MANRYYEIEDMVSLSVDGKFKPSDTLGSHSVRVLRLSATVTKVITNSKVLYVLNNSTVRYNCGLCSIVKKYEGSDAVRRYLSENKLRKDLVVYVKDVSSLLKKSGMDSFCFFKKPDGELGAIPRNAISHNADIFAAVSYKTCGNGMIVTEDIVAINGTASEEDIISLIVH